MTLEKYWRKRKFEKTPEPKGKILKTKKSRFVVQEHWATHHHFDFRLEMEGVLKSWAVPKGVPEKAGAKRLAVAVEDHPVDYIDFEGKISEGLYGAGTVKIFDKGEYELIEKTDSRILFILKGKKLKGNYNLIKFKKPNQWLLFKIKL
jgi:bifunctional non-homologous end joining protein LigD